MQLKYEMHPVAPLAPSTADAEKPTEKVKILSFLTVICPRSDRTQQKRKSQTCRKYFQEGDKE